MRNANGLNQDESSGSGKKCWESGYIFKLQPRLAEKNTRIKNYSKALGLDTWKDGTVIKEVGNAVIGANVEQMKKEFSLTSYISDDYRTSKWRC